MGETFRLPFFKRAYLTIKFDEGRFDMPPDWRARAMDMFVGKRPADAEFLAHAWWRELLQRQKFETERNHQQRCLERKLQALRSELRLRNTKEPPK